jgi:hypothetical protein
VNAPERPGVELRVEAEAAFRPGAGRLDLDPALSLSLLAGSLRFDASLPASARVLGGGVMGALGDFELGASASLARGGVLWSVGLAAAAPTGREPPWEERAGAGSPYWRADARIEAARVMDPVVAAARIHGGVLLPRRPSSREGEGEAGLGLSFAEALNDRASLGLSASLETILSSDGPSFSGGAAMALSVKGRALSYRAALSWGLGAEGEPALSIAVARSFGKGEP